MDKSQYDALLELRREKVRKEMLEKSSNQTLNNIKKDEYRKKSIQLEEKTPQTGLLTTTSNPLYKLPVFLSIATPYLPIQTYFLDRVINQLMSELLFPRTLGVSDQYTEPPLTDIRRMVISSFGLIAVAFRRAFVEKAVSRPGTPREQIFENFWLTSPYLQIEPSMAYQQGLPLMLLVESGVSTNSTFGGILEQGAAPYFIVSFNLDNGIEAVDDFFNSVFWKQTFLDWVSEVRSCYTKLTLPPYKCNCQC